MWAPFLDGWRRKDETMGIEDLQYGDTYELRNGDSCVYVCRELEERDEDQEMQLMSFELVLINTFTGEEHNINEYNDNLTHCENNQLDIVG